MHLEFSSCLKGSFTPSDSVTVTVAFDGQNGSVTRTAHQCSSKIKGAACQFCQFYGDGEGVARCEQTFKAS